MSPRLPLIAPHAGALDEWKPRQALSREAEAKAVKEYARAVKDWSLLDDAVDQQISDQRNLVGWWREHIQKGKGGKRGKDKQQRQSRKT